MEVILQEDYPALGYVGDRVVVKNGYARNFLLPRGIAVQTSSRNAKMLEHKVALINAKRMKLKTEAEKYVETLEQVTLEFKLKAGEEGGKSFGSVTTKDVEEALCKQGHEVERKQVRLPEPIKSSGEYKVEIRLHSEVSAFIGVQVTVEIIKKKKEEDKRRRPRRGRKGEAKDADEAQVASETEEAEATEAEETQEAAEIESEEVAEDSAVEAEPESEEETEKLSDES